MRKPPVDLQAMREAIALERGFKLYAQYTEQKAADYLRVDQSTLKRWRLKGKARFVPFGGGVRYMGIMLADMICGGPDLWDDTPDENSSSEPIGSPSGPIAPAGAARGLTQEPVRQNVLALARTTFPKPSGS